MHFDVYELDLICLTWYCDRCFCTLFLFLFPPFFLYLFVVLSNHYVDSRSQVCEKAKTLVSAISQSSQFMWMELYAVETCWCEESHTHFISFDKYSRETTLLNAEMGIFRLSPKFWLFAGLPKLFSRFVKICGEKLNVYMYIITASCWRRALQLRSRPPFFFFFFFYPFSLSGVGPEAYCLKMT